MTDSDSSYERYCDMDTPVAKRQKTSAATHPKSIVSWNCNGLRQRESSEVERLVRVTGSPDVVVIQEVKCKALSPNQRDKMDPKDAGEVSRLVETVFRDYTPLWSLSDKRHAGTCCLLHSRLGFRPGDENMSFSMEGATDLLLQTYGMSREEAGVYQATAAAGSPDKKQASTTMKSFFATKKAPALHKQHHPEGRFQFLQFPNLDLIHTYVPNHGNNLSKFQRRQTWDDEMLQFLMNRRRILEKAGKTDRPLLWTGDLNVARDHRDGTHWKQRDDGTIYEYWTDEGKDGFIMNRKSWNESWAKVGGGPKPECYKGVASFTPIERQRFKNILSEAQLTDIWRELHPNGITSHSNLQEWDKPHFTWRGALSEKSVSYQGRGQRIDYFLTSNVPLEKVVSCEILGYGTFREGLFCGSDHCAIKLQLDSLVPGRE